MRNSRLNGRMPVLSLVMSFLAAGAMAQTLGDLPGARAVPSNPGEAGSNGQGQDILSCPFDELLAAYTSFYSDVQQVTATALYNEVTRICTERQDQVKRILSNERELRTLLEGLIEPVVRVGSIQAAACPEPEPVLEPAPPPVPDPVDLKAAKAEEIARDALYCAAPFQVAAILGSPVIGPGLNAILLDTDTGEELTVRVGDVLPGGVRIDVITMQGVTVEAGGEREQLPNRPSSPEVHDGGGLIAIPATVQELYDPEISATPNPLEAGSNQ
ncbi:hypothetical protein [uncultured Ruegeria sp.]|uniref:hypothetical protein n=1 Tax=uncultured Ruegeria sp. TaxID=259304 RepID=UPI002615623D|nr:hypothetical protein [uncultured Ruegeria sp.]